MNKMLPLFKKQKVTYLIELRDRGYGQKRVLKTPVTTKRAIDVSRSFKLRPPILVVTNEAVSRYKFREVSRFKIREYKEDGLKNE